MLDEFVHVLIKDLVADRQQMSTSVELSAPISDFDQGVLYYICGYMVGLLNKKHGHYSGPDQKRSEIKEILQKLKLPSHGNSDYIAKHQAWTNKMTRGGLQYPCDAFFLMIRQAESLARKTDLNKLCKSSLAADILVENIMADFLVQHHWTSMMGDSIDTSSGLLLEDISHLFLKVRGFAVAKYVRRQQSKELSVNLQKRKEKHVTDPRKPLRKTLKGLAKV